MAIKAGERMPAGKFKEMGAGGPQDVTTAQLFDGKRVILFSVPGAFTPTCNAKHLPGFIQQAAALHAKGIDTIACMELDGRGFGMGMRGQRFAIVVDNGVATKVLIEAPGEFKLSSAEYVLGQL